MKQQSRVIYEFGPYRMEPAECQLLRDGQQTTLRPKLFDLLGVLVEHSGQMLTKDELLVAVWPDTTIEESNLTVSINALRKVLGDDYIETVARRGYRFTAAVRVVETGVSTHNPGPTLNYQTDATSAKFEFPGGAMPLHSQLYIRRSTDDEFLTAIGRRDSIVLVKGARQVGKSSLLARGLQQAREAGAVVVLTDFQHFTIDAFASLDKLLLTLAELIADRLELSVRPNQTWNSFIGPSSNFERYLRREVLAHIEAPLVWGLDEVDRIFNCSYASEMFGLFRSWHNLRALDPTGPWPHLTLALAYATEAHLFITDLNQSPFNVGTRLKLDDFVLAQVAELNLRYRSPLDDHGVASYYELVGGHPYLVQRGLFEMTNHGLGLKAIEERADHDEGIFGDHLQRLLLSLERDPGLSAAVRSILQRQPDMTTADFYRLRSAGVITGDAPRGAGLRCELYARYLKKRLL
jgi:DNA-binding winged helix-turn-helix (wHTH) protein